jgi:hypothetical protein
MAILTRNEFTSLAVEKVGFIGLSGPINESRKFSKTVASTSVFLSHSHKDKEVVKEAKIFFENLGVSIYVDWADQTMPERTNGRTAQQIKNKIISGNDKFILLATNNAISSKWCNWEVGIADPFKLLNKKIALLPLADNSGDWKGNEFLQVYPRIERNTAFYGENRYTIYYPDGSQDKLEDWLKRK